LGTEKSTDRQLHLIRDKSELDGTCYFEFFPGVYPGECWNETSVYLCFSTLNMIEKVFETHVEEYDPYKFIEIQEPITSRLSGALIEHAEKLRNQALADSRALPESADFDSPEQARLREWLPNKKILAQTCEDLANWLLSNKSGPISILGI